MESEFLDWLRGRLPNHPQLRLGPGDDAALLSMVHERHCAVTVDLLSDGIDFDLKRDDPRRLGHKALAVNLSDLAAMAAEPLAVVVALLLPRNNGLAIAKEIYEGMLPLAEHHKVCIAGGDTNSWDGSLVISITAIGQVTDSGALMRDGAKPGDRIIVTGNFGGSILGKHLDFEPRLRESLHLIQNYKLNAGIDCSDGLSKDLHHLCQEAKCGAVIAMDRIPISQAAVDLAAKEGGKISALQHALQDGEDFELIMAVPVDDAVSMVRDQPLNKLKLTDIGHFVAEPGLWLQDKSGHKIAIEPKGFEHRFS